MTRRALTYRRTPALERPVQRAAIKLIRMAGYEPIHVPNGVKLSGDKMARVKQAAVLKADGLRPGFMDLIVMGPAPKIGFLECKREGGSEALLDPDQIWWRARCHELGWPWFFLNRPEDVFVAFREWGWR